MSATIVGSEPVSCVLLRRTWGAGSRRPWGATAWPGFTAPWPPPGGDALGADADAVHRVEGLHDVERVGVAQVGDVDAARLELGLGVEPLHDLLELRQAVGLREEHDRVRPLVGHDLHRLGARHAGDARHAGLGLAPDERLDEAAHHLLDLARDRVLEREKLDLDVGLLDVHDPDDVFEALDVVVEVRGDQEAGRLNRQDVLRERGHVDQRGLHVAGAHELQLEDAGHEAVLGQVDVPFWTGTLPLPAIGAGLSL
jgi:hypothetical protein